MTYMILLATISYFFYYIIYKYIIEIGVSYIYWHLWHTTLAAGLTFVSRMGTSFKSIVYGNCIISILILFYVIVAHLDVLELLTEELKKIK